MLVLLVTGGDNLVKKPLRGVFYIYIFLGKSAIIGKTDIEQTNADF